VLGAVSVELQGWKPLGNPISIRAGSLSSHNFPKGELVRSAKSTLAAFVVLLAAVSSHGVASAQDYFSAIGEKSEHRQLVNRTKSKPLFSARASQATSSRRASYRVLDGAYGAARAQQNETWKRTYPDYPLQNGGGG
jgi:hypothetical protein